jgi:hypothetical protein
VALSLSPKPYVAVGSSPCCGGQAAGECTRRSGGTWRAGANAAGSTLLVRTTVNGRASKGFTA